MNGNRNRVFILEVLEVEGHDEDAARAGVEGDDRRGYLKFDGASVYARSGSASGALQVEGKGAPEDWTKVSAPARILIGGATLVVRDATREEENEWDRDADDRTVVTGALHDHVPERAPPPDPDDRTEVTGSQHDHVPDRVPTQVDWLSKADGSDDLAPPPTAPQVTPALLVCSPRRAPPVVTPLLDVPPPPPPPPRARSRAEQLFAVVADRWTQTPLQRKVIFALLPVAFVAMCTIFGAESPAQPAPTRSTSSASMPTRAPAVRAPETGDAGLATASSPASEDQAPLADAGAKTDKGKTAVRLAVDAIAAGDYATALDRYQQLAAAHADQPAYAQATRILQAKVDGGAP